MIGCLLALGIGSLNPSPDPATLIYYNARMALRERESTEAVKLWLLRNALQSKTGELSEFDDDFRSAAWVATANLGLCQDGLALDNEGAGLWPLALHNWFLRNMRRGAPGGQPAPFDAFDIPQQQRFIGLDDVLSLAELRTVRFYKTRCYRMKDALAAASLSTSSDTSDRKIQLRVLKALLEAARTTVSERVNGQSTIHARLIDMRLKEVEQLDRATRRAYREKRRRIRQAGGKAEAMADIARSTEMAQLLAVAVPWGADDWLALEPGRRLYLYNWMRRAQLARQSTDLAIIDRLTAEGRGQELSSFIAFTGTAAAAKKEIWSGARGQRLLGLERKTGFRERAAIALHRGVDAVGAGALADALRSFAYALHFAGESTEVEPVRRLALRWLSFVASQFEVTNELVTMLVQLVPRSDLGKILEDLMWEAALGADKLSFDRTLAAHRGRGGLRQRSTRLEPLAGGDAATFLRELGKELDETPHAAMRFTRRFLGRLETQDGDVRLNHRDLLRGLRELLIKQSELLKGGLGRTAGELEGRTAAMLEGLPAAAPGDSARDRARGLSPATEVFAGNIRMAPSDPLPWPFAPPNLRPPSVFKPLPMTPVEWPATGDADRGLVMGWKLGQ